MHYIFVINGRQDFAYIEEEIRKQLENVDIHYTVYLTTGVGDGTRYTRIYCDLHRQEEVCFVACGGMGICNEVASGIVGETNKSMALIPYGFTNDIIKSLPERDYKSLEKILNGTVTKLDILRINDNYALNVCNFGFDSIVAIEANYLTEIGKSKPYERGIARAFIGGRFNRIRVVADGVPLNRRLLLSCSLANGQYVGGQFRCAPKANLSDGYMDICLLKAMSTFSFFRLMKDYQKGNHLSPKYGRNVTYTKAKHVDIHSKNLTYLVLDGEMLPGKDFSVDLIPQAIRFVIPSE